MSYKKVLQVLEKEVGYEEGANNDNKYGKEYGLNNQPYCVILMWWAFKQAGLSNVFCGGTKQASCTKVKEWAQANGCWVTKNYQPGDLLMFNFKGTNVTQHIGFLKEVKGGVYYTIEGNTSPSDAGSQDNGAGVWAKKRKLANIVGAFRPNYSGKVVVATPQVSAYKAPQFKDTAGLFRLEKYNRGPAVRALQTLLNLHGAQLTVDGDFGEDTEKALEAFRKKHRIIMNKNCGREVWEKLING